MKIPLLDRLYVRLWLAVLLAVILMALLMGWLLRQQADKMRAERLIELSAREVVIRTIDGAVVGQAWVRPVRIPGRGLEFQVTLPAGLQSGDQVTIGMPSRGRGHAGDSTEPEPAKRGTEDRPAQPPHGWIHQLRNPANPEGAQLRLVLILMFFSLAVVVGSYPVVRRLTKRLEALQRGVEQLAAGDLRTRVPEQGRDEVAFLAQRFNRAADQVQALVQSQQSLLANASHELRSPLARIRMGLELMASTPSASLKAELLRNMAELDALIDEILLASRLQVQAAGALRAQREPVDMLALAAEEGSRVNVSVDWQGGASTAVLTGDARLLRRLLRNLLENGKRHGRDEVLLSLKVQGEMLKLEVSDRGPGVPEPERERIFEPFYRTSGASESAGGVGLGLALVRSIAQQHEGSVVCLERVGGGARFVVSLPITPQARTL